MAKSRKEIIKMTTPTVADVVLQTKMRLPEVASPMHSAGDQLLSQPFSPPGMINQTPTRSFIPADLDLSDLRAPQPDGASALLSSKMVLPQPVPVLTVADQILRSTMHLPILRPEEPKPAYIPADVDLSVDVPSKEPTVADQLLRSTFTLPVLVKPQSVADRVLSTRMTLPGSSFSQAVARTADDSGKDKVRSVQPEL